MLRGRDASTTEENCLMLERQHVDTCLPKAIDIQFDYQSCEFYVISKIDCLPQKHPPRLRRNRHLRHHVDILDHHQTTTQLYLQHVSPTKIPLPSPPPRTPRPWYNNSHSHRSQEIKTITSLTSNAHQTSPTEHSSRLFSSNEEGVYTSSFTSHGTICAILESAKDICDVGGEV